MATLGEELDVLDINLEAMEDIKGREEQVSERDLLEVTSQPDRVSSVLGSDNSNEATSFPGFTEASASGSEKVSKQQAKSAHSTKKSQHKAKSV